MVLKYRSVSPITARLANKLKIKDKLGKLNSKNDNNRIKIIEINNLAKIIFMYRTNTNDKKRCIEPQNH